jgi:ribosomal protein S18 acetylase RimI-like enzyme
MNNNLQIRPVEIQDIPAIRNLLEQLGYRQSLEQLREKLGAVPEGCFAYVAEIKGEIAGFMSVHIIDWLHRPDAAARLSALVVDENHRRSGIGRALIALAENNGSAARLHLYRADEQSQAKGRGHLRFP